jgi:L-Ala-D/L-Glu epimerase
VLENYGGFMPIDNAELHALHIPFRMNFSHSQAKRLALDSFILKVSAGGVHGFGEAVARDYVSGKMGDGTIIEHAARAATRMLEPFVSTDLTLNGLREWSRTLDPPESELPLLCAVETALIDLLCRLGGSDIYTLLEKDPVRHTIIYGGTLPMLPAAAAQAILEKYRALEIPNLRIKLGNDIGYNRNVVTLTRSTFGDDFDLRVDANGIWEVEEALENLSMLADFGISTVEEPFGRDTEKIKRCLDDKRSDGFTFVADESILSSVDLDRIIQSETYSMINIRLSKNGGLLRSLELEEAAVSQGIAVQLGCHVGETGILSAAGRAAASLMREPVYVDGSFDEYLLIDNITTENLTFGRRGRAGVIRGEGLGFTIDENALVRLTYEHRACI